MFEFKFNSTELSKKKKGKKILNEIIDGLNRQAKDPYTFAYIL